MTELERETRKDDLRLAWSACSRSSRGSFPPACPFRSSFRSLRGGSCRGSSWGSCGGSSRGFLPHLVPQLVLRLMRRLSPRLSIPAGVLAFLLGRHRVARCGGRGNVVHDSRGGRSEEQLMPLQWRSMMGTDGVGRSSSDNLVLQLSAQQQQMDDALHGGVGRG